MDFETLIPICSGFGPRYACSIPPADFLTPISSYPCCHLELAIFFSPTAPLSCTFDSLHSLGACTGLAESDACERRRPLISPRFAAAASESAPSRICSCCRRRLLVPAAPREELSAGFASEAISSGRSLKLGMRAFHGHQLPVAPTAMLSVPRLTIICHPRIPGVPRATRPCQLHRKISLDRSRPRRICCRQFDTIASRIHRHGRHAVHAEVYGYCS
jgi:hypothetical protein